MNIITNINLQLFAEQVQTANNTFGRKMNEAEARLFYRDEAEEALYESYTAHKYFDTFTHPKNKGKQGRLTVYDKMSTNGAPLQEGVLPREDEPFGKYYIDYTLDDFGGYTKITDQLDVYSVDTGETTRIQRSQANAAGEVFQDKASMVLASTTNVFFAGTTNPTTLAEARANVKAFDLNDFMSKIKPFLTRAKVQKYENNKYYVLLAPEVVASVLTTKKDSNQYSFIEFATLMKDKVALTQGQIADFNNFVFIEDEDNIVRTMGENGNGTIYGCLVLGKYRGEKGAQIAKLEGYGEIQSIVKPIGSAGSADPLDQFGSIGWKVMGWGGFIKYPQAVMRYECVASAPTGLYDEKAYPNYAGGFDKDGNAKEVPASTPLTVNSKQIDGAIITLMATYNGKKNGVAVRYVTDGSEEIGTILSEFVNDAKNVEDYASTSNVVDVYTNIACTTKITSTTKYTEDTTLYVKIK